MFSSGCAQFITMSEDVGTVHTTSVTGDYFHLPCCHAVMEADFPAPVKHEKAFPSHRSARCSRVARIIDRVSL